MGELERLKRVQNENHGLERAIGDKLRMNQVVFYPTGWGAGFGVIKVLVRPHDHVVMDALAHACLQAGATASVPNVTRFRHNDVDLLIAHRLRLPNGTDRRG